MASATKRADVVVIGAGMSGVAAAWSLRRAGISSIVLEARPDRIGGRIWSSYEWQEAPVDLGASWVTHMTVNPLVEIARANKIKLAPEVLAAFLSGVREAEKLTGLLYGKLLK